MILNNFLSELCEKLKLYMAVLKNYLKKIIILKGFAGK